MESGFSKEWTRTENFLVDSEKRYESWEETFMVTFSEYLGFPTKGSDMKKNPVGINGKFSKNFDDAEDYVVEC